MNPPPITPLRIEDLNFDDQPELALIVTRRAIEERLEWLVSYLAPNEHHVSPDQNINILKSHGAFDAPTGRAIRHVLSATNPVAHGQSVSPSVAAVVADAADRVAMALDEMISLLHAQLRGKPPRSMLAYAFLSLSNTTRRSIAQRLGVVEEDDDRLSRREFARAVFERASKANLLPILWEETARVTNDIPPQPPPELEKARDA